jgi:hypothetical protein
VSAFPGPTIPLALMTGESSYHLGSTSVVLQNRHYLAGAASLQTPGSMAGVALALAPTNNDGTDAGSWVALPDFVNSSLNGGYVAIAPVPLYTLPGVAESDALAVAILNNQSDITVGFTTDGGSWTSSVAAGTLLGDTAPGLMKLAADVNGGHVALGYVDEVQVSAYPLVIKACVRAGTTTGAFGSRVVLPTDGGLDDSLMLAYDTTLPATAHNQPLYAAWTHDGTGLNDNYSLLVSRSADNGVTWSTPVTVATDVNDEFPALTVTSNGQVLLVAYSQVGLNGYLDVHVARLTASTLAVQGIVKINGNDPADKSGCSHHFNPAFDEASGDQNGRVALVYRDSREGGAENFWYVAGNSAGNAWTFGKRINQSSFANSTLTSVPSVVMDHGDLYFFWSLSGVPQQTFIAP